MKVIRNIGQLLTLGLVISTLVACSSNSSSNSGGYHNDSHYRSGINNHHHRNYRTVRPPRRAVRR